MLNVHVRKGETMERLHTRAYSDLLNDAIYTRRNTYTFTRIFVKMILPPFTFDSYISS